MHKRHALHPGRYHIDHPNTPSLTLAERAFQMWAVHPWDLVDMGLTREEFFRAHLDALVAQAAHIAREGCLEEPDGGNPSDEAVELSEWISYRIRTHIR
jgi:hypothetical protein